MTWTKSEERELRRLLRDKSLLVSEIAEILGKKEQTVRYKVRTWGIDIRARAIATGKLGRWNSKHAHLRQKAMLYFLTHTFEETCKKFGLSRSEFRSIQTVSYRDPALAHLRKDPRRKDIWTFDETMFLLRSSGLQPRTWIAAKLKRGGVHAVKEMVSRLNSNTRYINGIPKPWAAELLGHKVEGYKVKAGPTAQGVDCRPIIVPWVVLYSEARRSTRIPAHLRDAIGAMAKFQKRVHGTRGIKDTISSIQGILRRR